MRHFIAIAALGAALVPCASRAAALPPIHVGSVYATKIGNGPTPLVLIPGLGCGPWVWKAFVASLPVDAYTVYEITLAGFDGTPPVAGPRRFDGYATSIERLLHERGVTRPILIGHSMGGELTLHVAASSPGVRGAVIVDALPLYPPLGPGETLDSRKAQWNQVVARLSNESDADYATGERRTTAAMVNDPKIASDIADRVLTSDRGTVLESSYELATNDLHGDLAGLSVPTLVLGETGAGFPLDATQQFYASEYGGAKTVTVKVMPDTRHFIMLDQPDAFAAVVTAFVTTLP